MPSEVYNIINDMHNELQRYRNAMKREKERIQNLRFRSHPAMYINQVPRLINKHWDSKLNVVLIDGLRNEAPRVRKRAMRVFDMMVKENLMPWDTALVHVMAMLSDPEPRIANFAYDFVQDLDHNDFSQYAKLFARGMDVTFRMHVALKSRKLPYVINYRIFALLKDASCLKKKSRFVSLGYEKQAITQMVDSIANSSGFPLYQSFIACNMGNFKYTCRETVLYTIKALHEKIKAILDPIYDEFVNSGVTYTQEDIITIQLLYTLLTYMKTVYSIRNRVSGTLARLTAENVHCYYNPRRMEHTGKLFDCNEMSSMFSKEEYINTMKKIHRKVRKTP